MVEAFAIDVPVQLQSFLALDFGLKRTGVAVGNRLLRSAQGLPTIQAQGDARFEQVRKRLEEWQPHALVVAAREPNDALKDREQMPSANISRERDVASATYSRTIV